LQSGFLSILYSIGSKPMQIWEKHRMLVEVSALRNLPSFCESNSRKVDLFGLSTFKLAAGTGQISRVTDDTIQSLVIELAVGNEQEVPDTYIACPADPRKTLGIKLPFLIMNIKNMDKYAP
jgi:hypothetical protein